MTIDRTGRQRKKHPRPAGTIPAAPSAAVTRWMKAGMLLLSAVCLIGLFSSPIADTDFWWHLKTGQYIVERHALPVPDPFAYTTAAEVSYRGEEQVRHFNLTHEWLSQVLMYVVYASGGFPGIVVSRVFLLAGFCGLAGFLAGRLSANFYIGIAATFAAASVAVEFVADRPGVVSFLCVAVFLCLLETRRGLWALPPLALLWSNCHGGFVLGWVVLVAYGFEAALPGSGAEGPRDRRRIWPIAACAIAASGLNPNGFGVVSTILAYRRSAMTANLIEWAPPKLWGAPYAFDILLYLALATLVLSWRKVRPAHWVLFAAFAGASLTAFRNTALIGLLAPGLIAAYFPFRAKMPRAFAWAPLILSVGALGTAFAKGRFPQPEVAEWTVPSGAADYLLQHHVTGPLFNTYEQGGYLIWRMWPQERVFIDGRSLSEAVYRDYNQILYNAGSISDQVTGPREELLNRFGVQVVVMNTMDFVSGTLYPLALALANPIGTEWELVYDDPQAVIFMRRPPAGIAVLPNKLGRLLRHLDRECTAYIESSPDSPLCARTLARYWLANGVTDDARRMLLLYLAHTPKRDEQAERMLQDLNGGPPLSNPR